VPHFDARISRLGRSFVFCLFHHSYLLEDPISSCEAAWAHRGRALSGSLRM
ncbi:hypothetical protein Pmar_PMAR008387, partial [Perkinsus marinus ATCC 50983]